MKRYHQMVSTTRHFSGFIINLGQVCLHLICWYNVLITFIKQNRWTNSHHSIRTKWFRSG